MTKPRVVFIAGVGRSGSTLLDRILGQTPGVVSVGEIYRFWSHRYLRRSWCSCGELVSECPFWSDVAARMEAAGFTDAEGEERRQWRVASLRNAPILPWQPWRSSGYASQRDRFIESREKLYEAIAAAGGGATIIDSSKIPRFALTLAASKRFDLRIVHLVRDSRAGAYSWIRPKASPTPDHPEGRMLARPAHQVSGWYMVSNPLTELLRLKGTPYLRLRYEDFVREPSAWAGKILDFAGIPERPVGLAGHEVTFLGDHLIAGNPIRKQTGTVAIRADEEWRSKMKRRDRLIATAITWPLLLRYRYPIRARGEGG